MDNRTVASAHAQIERVQANLTTHEAISTERFNELLARVRRIEHIILGSFATVIVLLVNLVLKT